MDRETEPTTPAAEGGEEHTLETASEEGSAYGGPFPVDPGQEAAHDAEEPEDDASASDG